MDFFRNEHCYYCSNTERTLTDLPYTFWFEVLTFLSVFDIINLLISSKRFKGFIFSSSSNYKPVLESINHVCDKKVWDRVLSFNFSISLNRVKNNLEDDLDIFLYLSLFISFFQSFFIFSFFTYLFLQKELVTRKNLVSVIVNSVLESICKFSTMNIFLAILL